LRPYDQLTRADTDDGEPERGFWAVLDTLKHGAALDAMKVRSLAEIAARPRPEGALGADISRGENVQRTCGSAGPAGRTAT